MCVRILVCLPPPLPPLLRGSPPDKQFPILLQSGQETWCILSLFAADNKLLLSSNLSCTRFWKFQLIHFDANVDKSVQRVMKQWMIFIQGLLTSPFIITLILHSPWYSLNERSLKVTHYVQKHTSLCLFYFILYSVWIGLEPGQGPNNQFRFSMSIQNTSLWRCSCLLMVE